MNKAIYSPNAPKAIGAYSQAILADNIVFLSGQIGLNPETGELVGADFKAQIQQVFKNLSAVVKEAGGDFKNIVKLTIYILDFAHFPMVNEVMSEFFQEPYPARATVAVKELPKKALVEIDGILILPPSPLAGEGC